MDKSLAVAVLAAGLGLAGCASTDAPNKSTASKDEGEVVTGSRISRKSETAQPVKNVSKDEFTRDSKVMATPGKGG